MQYLSHGHIDEDSHVSDKVINLKVMYRKENPTDIYAWNKKHNNQ